MRIKNCHGHERKCAMRGLTGNADPRQEPVMMTIHKGSSSKQARKKKKKWKVLCQSPRRTSICATCPWHSTNLDRQPQNESLVPQYLGATLKKKKKNSTYFFLHEQLTEDYARRSEKCKCLRLLLCGDGDRWAVHDKFKKSANTIWHWKSFHNQLSVFTAWSLTVCSGSSESCLLFIPHSWCSVTTYRPAN